MLLGIALAGDLKDFAERKEAAAKRGAMNAARRIATRAKLRLREETRRGGLGERVANAWQDKVYPKGKDSLRPAGQVHTRAPNIILGHSEGKPIRHKAGLWLAIPTEHTPRKGRRRATPLEVEAMFNQDLIVFPGRGRQLLAFVDAIRAKSGKGYRRATKRRTKDGRENELVLMFVLVPQVTLRQRLDWQRIGEEVGREWPGILGEEVANEMARA